MAIVGSLDSCQATYRLGKPAAGGGENACFAYLAAQLAAKSGGFGALGQSKGGDEAAAFTESEIEDITQPTGDCRLGIESTTEGFVEHDGDACFFADPCEAGIGGDRARLLDPFEADIL